jgi:anti-sigma factor RsiW
MTCQGVQERLSEWLDGELAAGVSRDVSEHLGECERCTRHAEQLRAVSGLLGELSRLEPADAGAGPLALQLELAGGAVVPASRCCSAPSSQGGRTSCRAC